MTDQITRDEFETVKQLLGSAARYAESANRGLDRLEVAQQRSQVQIDQLTLKIDSLAEAQKRTDQQLQSFIVESQRIMTQQAGAIQQLQGMSERLEALLAYVIRKEGERE